MTSGAMGHTQEPSFLYSRGWNGICMGKLVCYAGKKPINERRRQLCGYAREGHKISTKRATKV